MAAKYIQSEFNHGWIHSTENSSLEPWLTFESEPGFEATIENSDSQYQASAGDPYYFQ